MTRDLYDDPVPPDALAHYKFTRGLLNHAKSLPRGNVIALQGGWGRGKTDVLKRLRSIITEEYKKDNWPEPIWINPWQYEKPDLLSPLIAAILARLGKTLVETNPALRKVIVTLLRAGNAIAFKGAHLVVPGAMFFEPAAKPIDEYLKSYLSAEGKKEEDLDPVAKMPERFRELVESYLQSIAVPSAKLVICIDDLDRCLPDHQIAMLESLHFLTAARAPAIFFVAIDPTLVRQAAFSHYKTTNFDTNQYLNKLFDLRINLPSLPIAELSAFVVHNFKHMAGNGADGSLHDRIASYLGDDIDSFMGWMVGVVSLPEVKNPRTINKIFDRFRLFFLSAPELKFDRDYLEAVALWCVVSERWPFLREMCQYIEAERVNQLLLDAAKYLDDPTKKSWVAAYIPQATEVRDLGVFIDRYVVKLAQKEKPVFAEVDAALVAAGL